MARARELITLHEAAARLGVHYMTAYRYVRTGRLPAERDGAQWRVDAQELDRFRAADTEAPPRRQRAARADGPRTLAKLLVAGDETAAWVFVENALTAKLGPSEVYVDLLAPALRIVGAEWAAGRLSVADEHRASVVAQRLIGRLGPRFARRGRKRGSVVVAAPAGERHALPGAMFADLLRGAGFEAIDLGADTPPASIVDAAQRANRLMAVAVGATSSGNERSIRATVRALRRAGVAVPILVGGAAIADEAKALELGADGWTGADGASALSALEHAIVA